MTSNDLSQLAQLGRLQNTASATIPQLQAELNDALAAQQQLEVDLAQAEHQLQAARAELGEVQGELADALTSLAAAQAQIEQLQATQHSQRKLQQWHSKRQRIRMLTAGR
jgi:chromosome segregation ATPase